MSTNNLLITGATIVTKDDADRVLEDACILISDGRIAAIGGPIPIPEGTTRIDARGMIAMPGLVNAHSHLWQFGVRGIGMNWSGLELHLRTQSGLATAASVEYMRAATLLGALLMLDSGVTTVLDWCHGGKTLDHALAAIEALQTTGIRAIFARGSVKTLPQTQDEAHFSRTPYPREDAVELRRHFGANDGQVQLALALLGTTYTDLDVTLADLRLAEELGLMSSVHQGGYPGAVEGGYPEIIRHIDISRHNIVHGMQIPDEDLVQIIAAGASITATPTAEIRTGFREPMIRRVAEAGGVVSIGSDSAINAPSDMFTAMRDSLMVQRLFNHQHAEAAKPSARLRHGAHMVSRTAKLPPRITPTSNDALTWATRGNAQALGMQDEVGALTVGRRADLVLMNPSTLAMAPALNPIDSIVGLGSAASVDTVIVDGKILKSAGRLAYPRLDELIADVRRLGQELYASLGFDALHDPLLPSVF